MGFDTEQLLRCDVAETLMFNITLLELITVKHMLKRKYYSKLRDITILQVTSY